MKTYVDDDDKGSETNWSVYEDGDQAIPVSGEVILETEGDLNESQKLESLPDEEYDENNQPKTQNQSEKDFNADEKAKTIDSITRTARYRKHQSSTKSKATKASKVSTQLSNTLKAKKGLKAPYAEHGNNPFDTKSSVTMRTSLSNEQKRGDRSLNILTKKALNQIIDNKGDEMYPEKVNNSRVGVNNYLSQQQSARNQRTSQSNSIY